MASQMQVIFPERIKGAGLASGGPYHASDFVEETFFNRGTHSVTAERVYTHSIEFSEKKRADGTIGDLDLLKDVPVYIWSGNNDTVISPIYHEALNLFYTNYESNIVYN